MKPNTRRIWIFIGLKLKEIGINIMKGLGVCGIAILGSGIILGFVWGLSSLFEVEMAIGFALFFYAPIILGAIILGCFQARKSIKKWIKFNWRKAGKIEKQTRGK